MSKLTEEQMFINRASIQQILVKIKDCDVSISSLERVRSQFDGQLGTLENFKQDMLMEIIHREFPEWKDELISIGTWECKDSPIELCVYDDDYDNENCLICDQPEERK